MLLAPSNAIALVEFLEVGEAKRAFRSLAYTKVRGAPMFLEWAPANLLQNKVESGGGGGGGGGAGGAGGGRGAMGLDFGCASAPGPCRSWTCGQPSGRPGSPGRPAG